MCGIFTPRSRLRLYAQRRWSLFVRAGWNWAGILVNTSFSSFMSWVMTSTELSGVVVMKSSAWSSFSFSVGRLIDSQ